MPRQQSLFSVSLHAPPFANNFPHAFCYIILITHSLHENGNVYVSNVKRSNSGMGHKTICMLLRRLFENPKMPTFETKSAKEFTKQWKFLNDGDGDGDAAFGWREIALLSLVTSQIYIYAEERSIHSKASIWKHLKCDWAMRERGVNREKHNPSKQFQILNALKTIF